MLNIYLRGQATKGMHQLTPGCCMDETAGGWQLLSGLTNTTRCFSFSNIIYNLFVRQERRICCGDSNVRADQVRKLQTIFRADEGEGEYYGGIKDKCSIYDHISCTLCITTR